MTSATDYRVPARSWADIEGIALRLREHFALTQSAYFPVVQLIEQVLDQQLGMLHFIVGDRSEMGHAEGLTCPEGSFIMLREDVYRSACQGEGRARFTAAHELGHWVMHTNVPLARAERGDGTPPFRLAEPQANQFAAQILMPRAFIGATDTPDDVARRFGVSWDAARLRLDLLKKGRR